jgi:Tol biopolymer transport system component
MKRCPECLRDYSDETLSFCLDDGTALVDGPAVDAAKTVAMSNTKLFDEHTIRIHRSNSDDVDGPRSASSAEYLIGEMKRHKLGTLLGSLVVLFVIFGAGYGVYRLARNTGNDIQPSERSSAVLKIQPLTASGNVWEAAISPDGKFLAYTQTVNGQTGLWTKQISTNSNVQIVEPTTLDFFALRFSPDGQYVYYGLFEQSFGVVYRVPTLGGTPVKVIADVSGQISFSPDGKQMAFHRFAVNEAESSLIIADANGTNERKIASRTGHEYFANGVAWSADGKKLATGYASDSAVHPYIFATVNIADGAIEEIGTHRFDAFGSILWLKDQSRLVMVASDKGNNLPRQIWQISYPAGEAQPLTHDLTGYFYLSLTEDSKTLIAIQRETFGSVYFSQNGSIDKLQQISKAKHEGTWGMTLTPDGRVVYVSNASGATEIWSINADGSGAKQLTNDGISKYTPAVSPDGRYIVFGSEKNARHLWRINIDGSQPLELTNGSDEGNPRISPDGNWVIFDSYRSGKLQLWRVPIDGGEPQALTDYQATEPDVSPDGRYIACFFIDEQAGRKWRIAIVPFDGGPPTKVFDVPPTVSIDLSPQWTPDGKGITYIDWIGDISNLWLQPVDGGKPKQLTDYKQGYIYRREWSRDGKKLALVRGSETSDAILITDF